MDPYGNALVNGNIPAAFCWTKFGTEAGEQSPSIFRRKEAERRENGGVFLWGIGQSILPSLRRLLEVTPLPEVLFSPIKSAPSPQDVQPEEIAVWFGGVGYDGLPYELPKYSMVTSRQSQTRVRTAHYALVCSSDADITRPESGPRLCVGNLRNLMSGGRLGSSQVTSVVSSTESSNGSSGEYEIATCARLTYPYMVRLTRWALVSSEARADVAECATKERAVWFQDRLHV